MLTAACQIRARRAALFGPPGVLANDAMELARHSDPDLTLWTYAHSRLEDLARVVDNLPTSMWAKVWANGGSPSFAHILLTSHVSGGLNGTQENKPNRVPKRPTRTQIKAAVSYPARIRTWKNRTKTCCDTVSPPGKG